MEDHRTTKAYMLPSDAGRHLNMSTQLLNHHVKKKNIVSRELPLYTKCPYTGEMVFVTTKNLIEIDDSQPRKI